MTPKQTKKARKVMKAFEHGAQIEYRDKECGKEWIKSKEPIWQWHFYDYRIAKETLKPIEPAKQIKPQDWRPKNGHFFVDRGDGQLAYVSDLTTDIAKSCIELGLAFETKEAAKKAAIQFKFNQWLYKLAEELNDNWVIDWNDFDQQKCFIEIDGLEFNVYSFRALNNHTPVFKDKETAKKAVEIIKTWDWYFKPVES